MMIAWSGGVLPVLLIGVVVWSRMRHNFSARIPAGLGIVLSLVAIAWYMQYGRVSLGSSIGLRLGILLPWLVAGFYSLDTLRERHRVTGVSFLICLAAIAVFIFPVFLRL
jgi:hypothetical protein